LGTSDLPLTPGAVAKIQKSAPPVAKNCEPKPPLGKENPTGAFSQQIQSAAAAAVETLQNELPDEARAAYDAISTFFERKVWSVSHEARPDLPPHNKRRRDATLLRQRFIEHPYEGLTVVTELVPLIQLHQLLNRLG
jgi:hypothetical protein